MNEQIIIYKALENLKIGTHIKGEWEPHTDRLTDGRLTLELENKTIMYTAEIKTELRGAHIQKIIELAKKYNPLIVVATALAPKIKEELRHNKIAYLEGNGNIFLKHKETTLWIDTNKPIETEKETGNRAFTKTGLKLVFRFLRDENLVNRPYRQIAEQTDTGIGNITNIIRGLKQEGFLLPIAKNEYKLNNKKELLNKWIATYETRLKPTLKIGTFRFLKEDDINNWKNIPLQAGKTWWGGEPAADLITNFLRPAEWTLYTTETRNELIKNYRLIPDEKGNIQIYKKFWQEEGEYNNAAPALLVYADLINTNDRRCTETAQKIYDEYLQNKL